MLGLLKKRMKFPLGYAVVLILSLALVAVGCGGGGGEGGNGGADPSDGNTGSAANTTPEKSDDKSIHIGLVNWAEAVAVSNLWKVVLEEEGYEVELTEADAGVVFTGLAQGDVDFFVDSWLPHTHASYWEQYGDKLEDIGVWYDAAKIGLVVPAYMEAESIEDLNEHASALEGRIVGIDAGAGIMKSTHQAIEDYGLNLELLESSESAMLAELNRAIDAKLPVVVTGWSPHWKFAVYDLKYLEDPKGAFGGTEEIHIAARLGFSEDHPELAERLGSFTMNDDQLGSLEALIEEGMDPEDAAREWLKNNPGVVPGT